jgi:hypothetical protein
VVLKISAGPQRLRHDAVPPRRHAIGEHHRLGLRVERQQMTGAIGLLVRPRGLVLADEAGLVVLDAHPADHAHLGPSFHDLPVEEEAGPRLAPERPRPEHPGHLLARPHAVEGVLGTKLV